jgi:hypothetical protein
MVDGWRGEDECGYRRWRGSWGFGVVFFWCLEPEVEVESEVLFFRWTFADQVNRSWDPLWAGFLSDASIISGLVTVLLFDDSLPSSNLLQRAAPFRPFEESL